MMDGRSTNNIARDDAAAGDEARANRYRAMDTSLGRWTRTDPLGYVDGTNRYAALRSNPAALLDPFGLTTIADERELYDALGLDAFIESTIDFWAEWLGLATNDRQPIDGDCKAKLKCMVRAILWVESKHGTVGSQQPGRDPMQVGNTSDPAWPHISNQPGLTTKGSLVRRGALPGVEWADLPGTVAADPNLPGGVNPNNLPKPGHGSSTFDKQMSVFWGVLWYFYSMNQQPADGNEDGPKSAWNCQECSWDDLLDGAVQYNGGGNENYRTEIEDALALSGCLPKGGN